MVPAPVRSSEFSLPPDDRDDDEDDVPGDAVELKFSSDRTAGQLIIVYAWVMGLLPRLLTHENLFDWVESCGEQEHEHGPN